MTSINRADRGTTIPVVTSNETRPAAATSPVASTRAVARQLPRPAGSHRPRSLTPSRTPIPEPGIAPVSPFDAVPLPPAGFQAIGDYLSRNELLNWSGASRAMQVDLAPSIAPEQSGRLIRLPRAIRFALHQRIVQDMPADAGVLGQLINANAHLPREQREAARTSVTEKVGQLPTGETRSGLEEQLRLQTERQAGELARVDQFHEVIATPGQSPLILHRLNNQLGSLPESHRLDVFNALLEKTTSRIEVRSLANKISFLSASHRLAGIKTLLRLPQDQQVYRSVALAAQHVPDLQRLDVVNALLAKAPDQGVINTLAGVIRHLPELHKMDGFTALLARSEDSQVLNTLARKIRHLPTEHQVDAFNALLEKRLDWSNLRELGRTVAHLPADQRGAASAAIASYTPPADQVAPVERARGWRFGWFR